LDNYYNSVKVMVSGILFVTMIPKRRATVIILGAVLLSVVLVSIPLFHRYIGGRDHMRPLAGEVVSVSGDIIVIKDRHGREFNLKVSSTTKSRLSPDETLAPGTKIQAFGAPDESGLFILSNIGPLKVPNL
jgi:hypothetical protein